MENKLFNCDFCHTTSNFGITTILIQGKKIRFCMLCRNKVIKKYSK